MLGLRCSSNEEWVEAVNANPAMALIDHAHCEKKAATMAISLIHRYPERSELVNQMAELAEEEISHFRQVLQKMMERNIPLAHDTGDTYAQQLQGHIRKVEPSRLLDTLLVSSLIEARSCERFSILSTHATDSDLREFYRSLLASEARHRTRFLALARSYFSREEVDNRLAQLEVLEAQLVATLTNSSVIHG